MGWVPFPALSFLLGRIQFSPKLWLVPLFCSNSAAATVLQNIIPGPPQQQQNCTARKAQPRSCSQMQPASPTTQWPSSRYSVTCSYCIHHGAASHRTVLLSQNKWSETQGKSDSLQLFTIRSQSPQWIAVSITPSVAHRCSCVDMGSQGALWPALSFHQCSSKMDQDARCSAWHWRSCLKN